MVYKGGAHHASQAWRLQEGGECQVVYVDSVQGDTGSLVFCVWLCVCVWVWVWVCVVGPLQPKGSWLCVLLQRAWSSGSGLPQNSRKQRAAMSVLCATHPLRHPHSQ